MTASARAVEVISRVALLLALVAAAAYLMIGPYLDDTEETEQKAVTRVVQTGPVAVNDEVQWKLLSLRAYTRLVGKDGKEVSLDVPSGATIVVAELSAKSLPGARVTKSGFTCTVELRDDRGNTWPEQSPFGLATPTMCSDYDKPFKPGVEGKVAKVFVVPKSAVPHLIGVVAPPVGSPSDNRVLITP